MALISESLEPCPDFNRITPACFKADMLPDWYEIEDSLSRVKSQAENGCRTCLVIYEGFLLCGGYGRLRALNADFESTRVEVTVFAAGSGRIHISHTISVDGEGEIYTHSEFNVCSVEGMSYASRDALFAA